MYTCSFLCAKVTWPVVIVAWFSLNTLLRFLLSYQPLWPGQSEILHTFNWDVFIVCKTWRMLRGGWKWFLPRCHHCTGPKMQGGWLREDENGFYHDVIVALVLRYQKDAGEGENGFYHNIINHHHSGPLRWMLRGWWKWLLPWSHHRTGPKIQEGCWGGWKFLLPWRHHRPSPLVCLSLCFSTDASHML